MKRKNKIALLHASFRSVTGILIAGVTNCPYSHALVYSASHNRWFHASESRGGFYPVTDKELLSFLSRKATVYEFAGDLFPWVNDMRHRDYDWPGVLLWGFRYRGQPDKVYCFEAALSALGSTGIAVPESPVSGCDIAELMGSGQSGVLRALLADQRSQTV